MTVTVSNKVPVLSELVGSTVVVEKKGTVFFYEVVRFTETQVVLLENQQQVVSIGHLSVNVTPKKGAFLRMREYRRQVLSHESHGWCVKFPEGIAVLWDDKPRNSRS